MGVNLGATLPKLLNQRGWTQDQLADATGIRRTDVNALANGRIEAGPKRLHLIAAALDASVLELDPHAVPDERGLSFLDKLEAIADGVERLERSMERLLQALPQDAARSQRASPKPKKQR